MGGISWLAEDLRWLTASLNHSMVYKEWKCPMLPNPNNRTAFWKDPRLHPFASWYRNMEMKTSMEWQWRGMTKVLTENPVPLSLFRTQFSHGLTLECTQVSMVRGQWITTKHEIRVNSISTFISYLTGSTPPHYIGQLLCCLVPSRAKTLFFPSTKCPYQLWGSPTLIQWVPVSLSPG